MKNFWVIKTKDGGYYAGLGVVGFPFESVVSVFLKKKDALCVIKKFKEKNSKIKLVVKKVNIKEI